MKNFDIKVKAKETYISMLDPEFVPKRITDVDIMPISVLEKSLLEAYQAGRKSAFEEAYTIIKDWSNEFKVKSISLLLGYIKAKELSK